MYCPSGHCLCRTMQAKSRQIWDDLHDAEQLGTPYHEDTVTQSLALHLNRHHPAENRVHVFRRATEGKNGSDFIWLFFDRGLTRYFPAAVQAKRLYTSGRYEAFKADQVDRIRQYALIAGALPIYLTYNYPAIAERLWAAWQTRRRRWPVRRLDYQRDSGLIYCHADRVANVPDGQLSSNHIAQNGFPMWTVFCTCMDTFRGDALGHLHTALVAELEDAETRAEPVQETPPALRSWISGEEVEERVLREHLYFQERVDDEGFAPSFILGTRVGG